MSGIKYLKEEESDELDEGDEDGFEVEQEESGPAESREKWEEYDFWYRVIIDQVEKNPCLWMADLKSYRDKIMKANAWKSIASAAALSVGEAKRKYKSARNRYYREAKKLKPPRFISEWRYYDQMHRLVGGNGQIRKNRSISNASRKDCTTKDKEISQGDGAGSSLSSANNNTEEPGESPVLRLLLVNGVNSASVTPAIEMIDDHGPPNYDELDRRVIVNRGGEESSQLLLQQQSAPVVVNDHQQEPVIAGGQSSVSSATSSSRLDDCDSFGQFVAAELRSLDPHVRRNVRTKMMRMIEFAASGVQFDVFHVMEGDG